MDRRDFLKATGITIAATAVTACGGNVGGNASGKADGKSSAGGSTNGIADGDNDALNASRKGGITTRTNPKDGDEIGILGYGCMRWQMKKNDQGKNLVDQESVNELVDYALAHGVNYFDSSPVYLEGQSEEASGIALSRHPRESYRIATKLSNFYDSSRDGSMKMYRKSFEYFKTDYIDYYLLHSLGRSMKDFQKRYIDNGILDFLLKEREKGAIRNLGFSFHGSRKVFDELLATHEKYHWDFVQIQLNWSDWTHASKGNCNAEYLYTELVKRGIPVVVMEPLLGGRLAKLPEHIVRKLKEREPEQSIASWAFRFAGTHPGVMCVLSGMTYMEHLQDNIHSYSPLVPMSEEELAYIEGTAEMMSRYPIIPCNDCKYCMPCPYGIDIPAILLHYNKCLNEGLVSELNEQEGRRVNKARRKYLISYDRSIEKIRQADHCISCGNCVKHCPQHISIPLELHKIDKFIEELKRNKL